MYLRVMRHLRMGVSKSFLMRVRNHPPKVRYGPNFTVHPGYRGFIQLETTSVIPQVVDSKYYRVERLGLPGSSQKRVNTITSDHGSVLVSSPKS